MDLRIAVSNPENEALKVTLEINRPLAGKKPGENSRPGWDKNSFNLPGGLNAGQSVVHEFPSPPTAEKSLYPMYESLYS
jgi:hypothetical protein